MTFHDALAYLESLTNYERIHQPDAMRRIRLERMHQLCKRLGSPQRRFRSILVAGTNGKGSICAMIYAILRQAGLRVGLYTSPHLEEVRERIRVNAELSKGGSDWITREDVAIAIDRVRSVIEDDARVVGKGAPTYFEVLTAAALWHFSQQAVEVAVLETGLGGRLDATNVVDQAISVFGPIGLDHTDVLGKDLVTIAREKAGIIKPRQAVISAAQQPAVAALLREAASQHGCRVLEYGRHLSAKIITHQPHGTQLGVYGLRGQYDDLVLPLLGRHQAENAALAIAAVESLSETGIPHSAVREGLARVHWPGRLEVVREQPLVVLDGAHNPHAALALRSTLEELWPRRAKHLLIGMSADKPVQQIAEILGPLASRVMCTTSRHPRACDPQRLAGHFTPYNHDVAVIPDPIDAYMYLLNTSGSDDVIVITGSLFLVGQLRAAVHHTQAQGSPSTVEGRTKGVESCRL